MNVIKLKIDKYKAEKDGDEDQDEVDVDNDGNHPQQQVTAKSNICH